MAMNDDVKPMDGEVSVPSTSPLDKIPFLTLAIQAFSYSSHAPSHSSFRGETPPKSLFHPLSLTLFQGRWTCLLGPSGRGKTTLLRLIANLVSPSSDTFSVTYHKAVPAPLSVAYMAQQDLLLPWLNVLENVCLGNALRGAPSTPLLKEKAESILGRLGLSDVLTYYPGQLSMGMRQRVALARTLLEDCPLVLMDEPFSAVDAVLRLQLQELAFEVLADKTVLLVTHDPFEALRLGHEIYVLNRPEPIIPAVLKGPLLLPSSPLRDTHDPTLLSCYSQLLQWIRS